MNNIEKNLNLVLKQITDLAHQYNRDEKNIKLIAVSKKKPAADIKEAYRSGQINFAENYIQEAIEKIQCLNDLKIAWHFIGAIQSNKTRLIAENFSWVHTLSELKHAQRLNDQRPETFPPLNVCIQLNLSNEDSKNGIKENQLNDFAQQIQALPHLNLRGLMTMPNPQSSNSEKAQIFSKLEQLKTKLQEKHFQHSQIDTLSMGMSGDMEQAIEQGSTMLRIGTAIFGSRDSAMR